MLQKKQILWESWNAKIEDFMSINTDDESRESEELEEFGLLKASDVAQFLEPVMSQVMYTPIGVYSMDSILKPSDKWDCWTAYTNFPITKKILDILNNDIDGIECLRVIGKYTFFIGVAKMFKIADVRSQIEDKICCYTENEILSDVSINETVELLKYQLTENNKHWSILVYPEGMVEYITSNEINTEYLNNLNNLLEKKKNFGGIILRSDHG